MIIVNNLTKVFLQQNGEKLYAVDDLSFTAYKGEIVVLLGVNGAGKTTAMRMLSTVLQPTTGTATLEGYDLKKDPHELNNLYNDPAYANIIKKLTKELRQFQAKYKDSDNLAKKFINVSYQE